jgi:type II secretory pathway predicted ATPase ExeA
MTDIIQTTFSLNRAPFGKDLPPDDLWLDDGRAQAIDLLVECVSRRGSALVKGEPGTGKNCVMRGLRQRLSPVHNKLAYVSNVTLGRRDFYRQVGRALDLEPKGTPAALFEAIQHNIESLHAEHRMHVTLILDEAHLLPDSTLSHLHILLNFDWDCRPLLSLVLVGLPELHDRLRLGIHRSLLTRLTTCVEIVPATPDQTVAYVRKRLEDAGARSELFAPDALTLLHEMTKGNLRVIDVLASASLRVAAQQDMRLVDRSIVRRAAQFTPVG